MLVGEPKPKAFYSIDEAIKETGWSPRQIFRVMERLGITPLRFSRNGSGSHKSFLTISQLEMLRKEKLPDK